MSNQLPYLKHTTPVDDRVCYLLADQDKKAIELVFDHYGMLLFNVINKILRDDQLAEDVLQSVLVKIWKKGNQFDTARGSLYTWLVQISKNAAIDKMRSKDYLLTQKSNEAVDLVTIANEKNTEDQVESIYLRQMVDDLPKEQQILINMSFFEGYSHKEIAERLDMPLGTVKTRIRNAVKHLRAVI